MTKKVFMKKVIGSVVVCSLLAGPITSLSTVSAMEENESKEPHIYNFLSSTFGTDRFRQQNHSVQPQRHQQQDFQEIQIPKITAENKLEYVGDTQEEQSELGRLYHESQNELEYLGDTPEEQSELGRLYNENILDSSYITPDIMAALSEQTVQSSGVPVNPSSLVEGAKNLAIVGGPLVLPLSPVVATGAAVVAGGLGLGVGICKIVDVIDEAKDRAKLKQCELTAEQKAKFIAESNARFQETLDLLNPANLKERAEEAARPDSVMFANKKDIKDMNKVGKELDMTPKERERFKREVEEQKKRDGKRNDDNFDFDDLMDIGREIVGKKMFLDLKKSEPTPIHGPLATSKPVTQPASKPVVQAPSRTQVIQAAVNPVLKPAMSTTSSVSSFSSSTPVSYSSSNSSTTSSRSSSTPVSYSSSNSSTTSSRSSSTPVSYSSSNSSTTSSRSSSTPSYATGGSGKQFGISSNGNIAITQNGQTRYVNKGSANYNSTLNAMRKDTGGRLG